VASLQLDNKGVITVCANCGQKNRVAFTKLGQTARCGQCKQPVQTSSTPLEVGTTADFDTLVSQSVVPIVIDYWAPWCGPCRAVAPELEKVAKRSDGRFLVVKVNTDQLPDLGERHAIRSIPTLAVFSGGREVQRMTGARPSADIEALIAQAIR
jgi:thioredoxin 2